MTHKTNPKHLAIAMALAVPFAGWIAHSMDQAQRQELTEAPAPIEQVVETPAPAPAPVEVVEAPTPAPAKPTYRYTMEEAKLQFSYFYNLGRRLGTGHMDTALNAERQLCSHGFPQVDNRFVKTVRECYEATGDAYCWDR